MLFVLYIHVKLHLDLCTGISFDAVKNLFLAADFMKFFNNNSQSVLRIDGSEESTDDALNSHVSLENQRDSMETEMGIALTRKFDKSGAGLTNRLSKTFTTEKNVIVVCNEPNQTNKYCDDKYHVVGNLSSEVSAIYLAMQHSKLECVDEQSQDSISPESRVEPDEDDLDDFDPYTFIKDLPDLSAVVPKFRPVLLPKQTRSCPSTTLVLDLDGNVH